MKDDYQPVSFAGGDSCPLSFIGEPAESLVPASGTASWSFQLKSRDAEKKKIKLKITIYTPGEEGEVPEWSVHLKDAAGGVLFDGGSSRPESEVDLSIEGARPKDLKLEAHAPVGARLGDTVKIVIEACPAGSPDQCARIGFSAGARQSILALKTSIGHERTVADSVGSKAKSGKAGITAILSPTNLRGYVLIEGMNTDALKESVKGIRRARGLVDGETSFSEIDHFLAPKPLVSGIMEGDVVELVAGPFKGEKARVQQIDESKEEITVELFEAMVPIPVTVRGDHVRVLEKER